MFLKLGPKRKEFPLAALIPNLLTTLALCCGLAALHYAMKPNWDRALGAVVLAGIFDALDGRAARLLRVTSGFGAILDSLSDFLAFGVAPAVILHQWLVSQGVLKGALGVFALAAFITYALGAALRLARFTADAPAMNPARHAHEGVSHYFHGMPSPAAAGVALIPAFLANSESYAWNMPPEWVIALAFVIGVLMVTRIPMFSLKSVRLGRRSVAPLLVGVGLLAAAMVRYPFLTLAGISTLYALSIPLTAIQSWRRRAASRDAAPERPVST
ncbi:CDP-diacylglycerol---serine O-phosphatidyltransferase [Phycisphaerales bacterium]|nr:CDP-diacylglycerol---serine O-phosphatidyltransferase [Phycisphaerales bacterium]